MPNKFKPLDHRLYAALTTYDRDRGATVDQLIGLLSLRGFGRLGRALSSLNRLVDAGYVESRLLHNEWPNGGPTEDGSVPVPGGKLSGVRPRLYRPTAAGRQTLTARIQSQRH